MSRPQPSPAARRRGQQGITLIAAVLMLLIFALVTVAAFRNTLSSAQSIGNMQFRNESVAAANDAIDEILSSTAFADNPDTATSQMNTTPHTVDINGDGVADIQVTFPTVTVAGASRTGPVCLRQRPVQNSTLDPNNPQDAGCFGSVDPNNTGLAVSGSGGSTSPVTVSSSDCADTDWSITVQADDKATNTSVQVTQGVQVRRDRATAMTYCVATPP